MKPKVFVSRPIPEAGLKLLRKSCEVEINLDQRNLSKQEIIHGIRGKDALLCLLTDNIDKEILDSNPNLRIVSNYGVGFNNIDVDAATEKQIPVTNTQGTSGDALAEHTIGLIFAVSRRICEGDKFIREGKYKGWDPLLLMGTGLSGKTLGVIGLGESGKGLVEKTKGFGMKIVYYDVLRNREFEKENKITYLSLKDLLKESDFITLHVPLLPQTKHLIGVKELNMMKRTSYLINTSRGKVVDEEALVHALKHNIIAGAALDVFENEPHLVPGEKNLKNIVLTPHIASSTKETRDAMATVAAQNILSVFRGRRPKTQVNKKVKVGLGYKHPFYMVNGKIVKNKEELTKVLDSSSDHDYWYHANQERNDFANWINDVLKDEKLSQKLRRAQDRSNAVKILKATPVKAAKKAKKSKVVKKTVKKVKKKTSKKKAKKVKKVVKKTKVKNKKAVKKKPKKAVKRKGVKKKTSKKSKTKIVKKKRRQSRKKTSNKPKKSRSGGRKRRRK